MPICYIRISIILVSILLQVTSFGMNQITDNSFSYCPLDLHKKIFNLLDLVSQDQLRGTCQYWQKIGNERTSQIYLLDLLHSPSNTTKKTKARILFDAIYHKNYDLIEHILKITPAHCRLYYPGVYYTGYFDPYHIAQHINDDKILSLLQHYNYHTPTHGNVNKIYNNAILIQLLISAIAGNSDSITTIINIELKKPDIRKSLMEEEDGEEELTNKAAWIIENAFLFIIYHNDIKSISSVINFLNDYPEVHFWLDKFLKRACNYESIIIFEELMKIKAKQSNLNKVYYSRITFKNKILGINCPPGEIFSKNPEYHSQIEAILDKYGAKTYEELQGDQSILSALRSSLFVRLFYVHDFYSFSKIMITSLYSRIKNNYYIIIPISVFISYYLFKNLITQQQKVSP